MAAINFPIPSTVGEIFVANGTRFQWDGVAWTALINDAITVSAAPPTGPAEGDIWFDEDNARLYVYYDDGTSGQWVNVVAYPGTSPFRDNGTAVYYDGAFNVGIGTDTPLERLHVVSTTNGLGTVANDDYDEAVFENTGNAGITILTPSTTVGGIAFGDTANRSVGAIRYDHVNDTMAFNTSSSEKLLINAAGRVGVRTAFADLNRTFEVTGVGTEQIVAHFKGGSATRTQITLADTETTNDASVGIAANANRLEIVTNNTVGAVFDSGKLALNTTAIAPTVTLDLDGTDAVKLPVGTTAQRPTPAIGMIRYNSTTGLYEGYDGSSWNVLNRADYSQNRIINGNFRVWQRGVSFTTSGLTADRWRLSTVGGTTTVTQQSFALGDTLGENNSTYYLRSVVAGQSTAGHVTVIRQYIDSVRTYAGETITVMGWMRRSVAGNVGIELSQIFGSGGSPSAEVQTQAGLVAIGTSWTPFAITVSLPSISGKTLGTSNDYLDLIFWQSGGTDWDVRSSGTGIFNGTLEIWGIHILPGVHGIDQTIRYKERPFHVEIDECYRYYETGTILLQSPVAGNTTNGIQYIVRKRFPVGPTWTLGANAAFTTGSIALQGTTINGFNLNGTATGAGGYAFVNWVADAEI